MTVEQCSPRSAGLEAVREQLAHDPPRSLARTNVRLDSEFFWCKLGAYPVTGSVHHAIAASPPAHTPLNTLGICPEEHCDAEPRAVCVPGEGGPSFTQDHRAALSLSTLLGALSPDAISVGSTLLVFLNRPPCTCARISSCLTCTS